MLHLAGHGRKKCGFIWNADDAATASQEFDANDISVAIDDVAGQQGPLECVVLNACLTEEMGRLLRERGVPYVVCWKTPVQDATARELCEHFYRTVVEDESGARNYKRAFFAATDTLRLSSHTGGAAHQPRGADDMVVHEDVLHTSTTRNLSPPDSSTVLGHDLSSAELQEYGASSRGKVRPWHEEDVVVFLSHHGDSNPIHLWRARPVANKPAPPKVTKETCAKQSSEGEENMDERLKALFAQHGLHTATCQWIEQ